MSKHDKFLLLVKKSIKRWIGKSVLIFFTTGLVLLFLNSPPYRNYSSPDPNSSFASLAGKQVKISLLRQPFYIVAGIPLPPGTQSYESDRAVYYGFLDSIDEKSITIRPLDGLPQHFHGDLSYSHSAKLPRECVVRIEPLSDQFVALRVAKMNQRHVDSDLGFDSLLNDPNDDSKSDDKTIHELRN